jgi:hypothetical protein
MKKINIFLILLLFGFSLIWFVKSSVAQGINSNTLFNLSTIVQQTEINANAKTPLAISLLPFTTINIKPGTFKEDVMLFVYKGDFEKIKTILPKGQSPISSYYLIFRNARQGFPVNPIVPLEIQSYNNYINTNTYFYPTNSPIAIDTINEKNWPGHIKIRTDLPINDSGFIVAMNKILQPNDSSFLNSQNTKQNLTPTATQNNLVNLSKLVSLWPFALALIIVISLIFIIFWFISKKQKRL